MSSELAISVRGLTKEYRIARSAERHNRITDAAASAIRGLFRRPEFETFRALDDVSFDVRKGEVLGIVGRNGAGKSTLLKVLSRITEPTTGEALLYGRVGSLLEVGTGFHPELTGRENVYLNGSILGMRKREIDRQFDAIVDFAEVERFLDTPVKRYSSGMYVRLAFAVAAHLNPEILIVDEVLAVGDAQFQQKCLGKMEDVSRQEGRTVLFVSHNMAAVRALCRSALLMRGGRIVAFSNPGDICSQYLEGLQNAPERLDTAMTDRMGTGALRLVEAKILSGGIETSTLVAGRDVAFEYGYRCREEVGEVMFTMTVFNSYGVGVASVSNWHTGTPLALRSATGSIRCEIPSFPCNVGRYRVAVSVTDRNGQTLDHLSNILAFNVDSVDFFTTGIHPDPSYSLVVVPHVWSVQPRVLAAST